MDFWNQAFVRTLTKLFINCVKHFYVFKTCTLIEYTASNVIGYGDSKIMLDANFNLDRLNEHARNYKISVSLKQNYSLYVIFKSCNTY